MSGHDETNVFWNWAKERIDEMDAALASLEAKAHTLQAEYRDKGEQLVAELKKRRDTFKASALKEAEAGEAAWERANAQLESQWTAFEEQVNTFFNNVGKEFGHEQESTFRDIAAAQAKAWEHAAHSFQKSVDKVAAGRRSQVEAAIKQMKADSIDVHARLQKMKHAQNQSWSALSAALAESRKAFDKANHKTWDAFRRAAG